MRRCQFAHPSVADFDNEVDGQKDVLDVNTVGKSDDNIVGKSSTSDAFKQQDSFSRHMNRAVPPLSVHIK